MEDDLKKKWKTNRSTKVNLIGCDTIVNSPSLCLLPHIQSAAVIQARIKDVVYDKLNFFVK